MTALLPWTLLGVGLLLLAFTGLAALAQQPSLAWASLLLTPSCALLALALAPVQLRRATTWLMGLWAALTLGCFAGRASAAPPGASEARAEPHAVGHRAQPGTADDDRRGAPARPGRPT